MITRAECQTQTRTRAVFVARAREFLREFACDLDSLTHNFEDRARHKRLCRSPRVLAGHARAFDSPLLAELATVVEQAARRLREDGLTLRPDRVVALREAHEALAALVEVEQAGPVAFRLVALVAARVRAAFELLAPEPPTPTPLPAQHP